MMIRGLATLVAIGLMANGAMAQQAEPAGVEIEAAGPQGPLKGTVLDAGKGAPVAILIPGSGPTDRDGNSPLGIKAAHIRMLAQGLAAQGVTTIRIDKRGTFASKDAVPPGGDVRIADYVTDIGNWMAAARARTGARCVWLIGHSEGGMVALATAQVQKELCGVVLAASLGRKMTVVMREQFTKNPANAPLMPQITAVLDSIEAGKVGDTSAMHPALAPIFSPVNQRYLIDTGAYDPGKLIAAYKGSVMIVQGGRDLQTTMDDANAMKAGQPAAVLQVFPEMNHLLKDAPADPAGNLATYNDPNLPLTLGVVDAIAAFMKR
ncbi:alpha/beta hydrolase [Sphingomonas sp.]|uniref:alpha/beta hydrolase n=1 Tax=Sphingomonas sp. TaxID=28214 RepID=UPI0025D1EB80|nr:alpha/beta hydrolase [Sphingomonas sp.]